MDNDGSRAGWRAALIRTCALVAAAATELGCQPDAADGPGLLPDGKWLGETAPSQVLSSTYCDQPQPGDTPLRRLTNAEYRNTLLELGLSPQDVADATASLPSEPVSLGFRNGARTLQVDTLMSQKYAQIARTFRDRLAPSCASDDDERGCVTDFVDQMGLQLFRRPLRADEISAFVELFDGARMGGDTFAEATAWIVEALLQSPDFLYRVEIPQRQTARVTGYEMASRLSYTFWQSPPDEELLRAAGAGELETRAQVESQVRRLLHDARALRTYEFFEQWLGLDRLTTVDRDPQLYPGLPSNLASLLRTESEAFIKNLLSRADADLTELLTAPYTYANQELAQHYGIDGPSSSTFERVEAPGRSGILTQGMLAARDHRSRTSIVRRGLKIRTDFLCQLVPAPPDTVDLSLDGIDENLTQAERLALHRESPVCNSCHELMDPIGMVFEGFDAVGRERTRDEYGSPIDAHGAVQDSLDVDGAYDTVPALAQALAGSREVEQCYLIQNFRFFFGREAERADLCSQAQLTAHFQETDHNLAEVLVGLAMTDAFLYKAGLDDLNAVGSEAAGMGGAPHSGGM